MEKSELIDRLAAGQLSRRQLGKALARRLSEKGEALSVTTTSESKVQPLRVLGEVSFLDPNRAETYQRAFDDARAVVHLAPPPTKEAISVEVERIARSIRRPLDAYVYGSTTGVFISSM